MNVGGEVNSTASGEFSYSRMIALTFLFFMWGFITSMNDVLIPHLKAVFDLSYTQAMLIQFCFFGAYFLISVPAGRLVNALGYRLGISIGLFTACCGCLMFIPAATSQAYWMFLTALFVLASGITLLQVAANPLVTLMGNPETASTRLTLTQAFNSLGATLAPIVGGYVLFTGVKEINASQVVLPYVVLAVTLLILAVLFTSRGFDAGKPAESASTGSDDNEQSLFAHRHLVLGCIAIFVYVGAEVAIGSLIVNYLGESHIAGMEEAEAAHYIAYYWGGALVGRFIGAAVMNYVAPGRLLAINGLVSVLLLAVVIGGSGSIAMWAILAVGLCNSIMFPTIFSLALKNLGENTSRASGLLCLAIVGGAIIPLLQGVMADNLSLQLSFVLPLLCYLYIAYYGVKGSVVQATTSPEQPLASTGNA